MRRFVAMLIVSIAFIGLGFIWCIYGTNTVTAMVLVVIGIMGSSEEIAREIGRSEGIVK